MKRCILKELYTSETTLAQKIVLTPLNNEFVLKIWNSTCFMLKNPPIFLKKIYKSHVHIQSCIFLGLNIFVFIHHKAMTALGPFWNSGQKFLLIVMHEGCSRLFLLFLKLRFVLHCKWKSYFHWVKIFSPDIYMYIYMYYIHCALSMQKLNRR